MRLLLSLSMQSSVAADIEWSAQVGAKLMERRREEETSSISPSKAPGHRAKQSCPSQGVRDQLPFRKC